jgi:hypothetical protein
MSGERSNGIKLITIGVPADLHEDTTTLVAGFAKAMAEKLRASEVKHGFSLNWKRPTWRVECQEDLLKHIAKGDPIDVANFCAFLWHHKWETRAEWPYQQAVEAMLKLKAWKDTVIDACVVNHISWDEDDPVKTLTSLVLWEQQIALDPKVSIDAQQLKEQAVAEFLDTQRDEATDAGKPEYVECACTSSEHTLRFVVDEEDNEIYTDVQLARWHPWYMRVWLAIKYVFGYQCKYGHWDCTIIQEEQAKQIIQLMKRVTKNEQ